MSFPLRAIYDNSCERSTLSVTGVPQLAVSNLHTNNKNEVWRSANTVLSATFTATYFSPETIGCVAFTPCNFSTSSTMQVLLYSDANCTALLLDSTTRLCCEGGGAKVAGLTAAQSASAYSYGGGNSALLWLPRTANVQGIKIIVTDSGNLQGYLEAARLIVGDYWAPQFNAEYGASISMEDSTNNFRTDAGNLLSDVGTRHKKLSMTLSFLQPADRSGLWNLVKYVGLSAPLLISLFPENPDKALEQHHTVYGKCTQMSQIAAKDYMIYSMPLEIEGL